MADIKHIIEPERFGTWIVVTFVIALLALGAGVAALKRTNDLIYITQGEVLLLNKKIEGAKPAVVAPAEPAAPEAAAE